MILNIDLIKKKKTWTLISLFGQILHIRLQILLDI